MKPLNRNEIEIILIVCYLCLILIVLFNLKIIINTFSVINPKEKISTLEYREITEILDKAKGRSIIDSYVYYAAPDKIRIERTQNVKTVEIYNGKRYIIYNTSSGETMSGKSKLKKPSAIEKGAQIDRILKSSDYEFFGYEEKDNRNLMVIGIVSENGGHEYLNKYWFDKVHNSILPYREENFVDNYVVSKTIYIYTKINKDIDKNLFLIGTKIPPPRLGATGVHDP